LGIGSHIVSAAVTISGTTFQSTELSFSVANQAPTVTIISPVNEADASVGSLSVILIVTHPTATHSDFTVQVSLDPGFVSFVSAVWQSGDSWTATLTIAGEANYYVYARAYDDTPGGLPTYATRHRVSSLPPEVRIETTGQTFAPQLNIATGATIAWTFSDSTTDDSGRPSKDFGSAETRVQQLTVIPSTSFRDLNFGFSQYDDSGKWYQAGAPFDLGNQNVSRILGMGRLALGLRRFMAAHNPFVGVLDFSGFSYLEDLELFQSYCSQITLTDCTSLIRCCVEQTSLTALDISPCADSLVDLRAAAMRGGSLILTMGIMTREAHWCVRSQSLTVIVPSGQTVWTCLPVVEEIWCFSTYLVINGGILAPISPYITSIQAQDSRFTQIDLANLLPAGRNAWLWFSNCQLTAINIDGCPGIIDLRLDGCNLSTVLVDYILTTINSYGTSNGNLALTGCMGPSMAGEQQALALVARGWAVTRADVVGAGTNSDTFTSTGQGWFSVFNSATFTIDTSGAGTLHRTDSGAYRLLGNPGVNLPVNYRVEATFPDTAFNAGFVGIFGRWLNGNGIKLLFISKTAVLLGDANGYGNANVTIVSPNSTTLALLQVAQDHTIGLEMNGNICTVWIDGAVYGYGVIETNRNATNTYYGFCGAGPWDAYSIAAISI
jgi:hypothetical protein